jgi:predicted short-subunit dehydrogenase-like oxidoreductase (DUF2520 family)
LDKKLAIIGAGNLATRVSIELHNQGVDIIQVFSRTVTSAITLAKLIGCTYVTQPDQITDDADIYLISVSDIALGDLLSKVNFNNKLIVHTAGSIDMEELGKYSTNYGVFYPLQTFSKYREVDFSNIPVCIEANTPENEKILIDLATLISKDIRLITSGQRKQIHLAAVFASNFTNHMYAIAEEILRKENLPFEIIEPLIAETASKVKDIAPRAAQTGPANRNDKNIINEHLDLLDGDEKLRKIYTLLSENIYEYSKMLR